MRERIFLACGALAVALVCPSCGAKKPADTNGSSPPSATRPAGSGDETGRTRSGSGEPILPDASQTPGDTLDVTRDDICVPGYSKKVRNVPQAVKEQAYANYRITHRAKGQYEIDHLISLELGGSNSLKNLWPQSYKTQPWNAHVKDALENKLHQEVCDGSIDLKTAQHEISQDWIAAYKKHFHANAPAAKHSGNSETNADDTPETTAHAPGDKVWVNTGSGKYWRPGTKYYGKTKAGEYMSEAEAQKAGYDAAQGQ